MAEYGDDLRVAALSEIGKEDDKLRVIFDGTHGVKVSPRIVRQDRVRWLEFPVSRDGHGGVLRASDYHVCHEG